MQTTETIYPAGTNDRFAASFEHLHLLKHPFYQAWMAGTLSRETLIDYAEQYYFHVDRFPRYIGAIHSHCENAEQRRELLENLNDEEGRTHGVPHPDLWLQFAEGMGASRTEVVMIEPRTAIRRVTATFFGLARASYAEGLGALYAYESQVPEIADSKITGLKCRYGVHDERTLEFFSVHSEADKAHRASILKMLETLSPAEQELACAAAKQAAQALWDFLSDVQAVSMPTGGSGAIACAT